MRRNASLLIVVLAILTMVFVFQSSAVAPLAKATTKEVDQPTLANVLAPRVFTRSTGAPNLDTVTFPITGFKVPFYLHLRNGDANGENRVSSATVSLNKIPLFKPSDFSQNVSGYDVEVALTNPSTLEVKLASAPGSKLTIWIEGVKETIVGPEGGRLQFTNGVILEIPAGAVNQPTEITTAVLPADVGQGLVADSLLSHNLRYLGGFLGVPDGFQFNIPIEVEFPVQRLLPGEIPLQLHVDQALGKAYPTNSDLIYDGVAQRIRMRISHFGGPVGAGASDSTDLNKCWTTECRERREIEALCTNPATNSNPKCEAFDALQPACCLLYPAPGPRPPDCPCCREGRIEVRTEDIDFEAEFGSTQCTLVSGKISVRYLDCDCPPGLPGCVGHPVETDTVEGASVGCEKLTWSLTVSPNPARIDVCQSVTLTSKATGTSPKGNAIIAQNAAYWGLRTGDDKIVYLDPRTGDIRGLKPGLAKVSATFHSLVAEVDVIVGPYPDMKVAPNPLAIHVFEQGQLKASIDCLCGVPGYPDCQKLSCTGTCSPLQWSVVGTGFATVDPFTGMVEGKAVGNTTVQAHMVYEGYEFSATIPVTVLEPTLTVKARLGACEWDAAFCYFNSRDGVDLTVRLELNGNPVPAGQDVWVNLGPIPQTLTPLNPVPGYPDDRQWTDREGQATWRISDIDVHLPYVVASVTGKAGGKEASTVARAITDDICYPGVTGYPEPYAQSDYVQQFKGNVGYSFNQLTEAGYLRISESMSVTDPCDSGPWQFPSQGQLWVDGYYRDTVLIIPDDLKWLLSELNVYFSIATEGSIGGTSIASLHGPGMIIEWDPESASDPHCTGASYSFLNENGDRCFASKELLHGVQVGIPFQVSAYYQAFSNAYALSTLANNVCKYDSDEAYVNVSQRATIQQVDRVDSNGIGHPLNYWIFSCSGRFTTPR